MSFKITHIDLPERKVLLRFTDISIIFLSIWVSTKFEIQNYISSDNDLIYLWLFTLALYFFLFGEIFQLFSLNISSNRFSIFKSLFITTLTTTFFFILTPFYSPSLPENRIHILYFFGLIFIPVFVWRFMYTLIFLEPRYFKDIIVISHSSKMTQFLDLMKLKGFHNVVCYISDKQSKDYGQFNDIRKISTYDVVKKRGTREVILNTRGFSYDVISSLNNDIITLFEEGINIRSFESFYEEITGCVPRELLDHNFYKYITLSRNNDSAFYGAFKRILDILVSCVGLIIFVMFLPLILLLNLIGNRGSLFYTQNRVGEKGQIFKIFKLRSMVENAEREGAQYAKKNDARITKFGKFLRNTRLDEFPQFYNILKGDMSVIGPRPERPEFVEDLEKKIPFYALRNVIKPGLTGWAQVNFPYANNLEEQEIKLRYDIFYIKEQNIYIDFKIIIKTITTVLFFRGQ